jgi:hypothetical protein
MTIKKSTNQAFRGVEVKTSLVREAADGSHGRLLPGFVSRKG